MIGKKIWSLPSYVCR